MPDPASPSTPKRRRAAAGKAAHLSNSAEALLLKHLIAGDTNAAINQALVAAGHLQEGEELSRQTFWRYRRDERYLRAQGIAAREAQTAGVNALARVTIGHADLIEAALQELMSPTTGSLKLPNDPIGVAKYRAALKTLEVSGKFLTDKLASGDLVTALRSLLERAENNDARDARLRAELQLEVQKLYNDTLRGLLAEARGEKPSAPPAEDDTDEEA